MRLHLRPVKRSRARAWLRGVARTGLGILVVSVAPASARVIHVDATFGSDSASGLTWAEALASVPAAVAASRPVGGAGTRPVVRVAAGTYVTSDVVIDFPLLLIGAFPPGGGARDRAVHASVLDASGGNRAMSFVAGSESAVLDGFTVRGAMQSAVHVEAQVLVQNVDIIDNAGVGIQIKLGRVHNSRISRNAGGGIEAGDSDCPGSLEITDVAFEDNAGYGLLANALGCEVAAEPRSVLRFAHLRISSTGPAARPATGLALTCCPDVIDIEVSGMDGPGVNVMPDSAGLARRPLTLSYLTSVRNTGVGIYLSPVGGSMVEIWHGLLWSNGGGDFEDVATIASADYTLSESMLAGIGNIVGIDPLLASGAFGSAYLSQAASGQAADSVAVDAGGESAVAAGLQYRTTRTDGVRDSGLANIGAHHAPLSWTVMRGTDPRSLAPHALDTMLPHVDAGAASPSAPSLLFYDVDTDEDILLRRRVDDVIILAAYQEFD